MSLNLSKFAIETIDRLLLEIEQGARYQEAAINWPATLHQIALLKALLPFNQTARIDPAIPHIIQIDCQYPSDLMWLKRAGKILNELNDLINADDGPEACLCFRFADGRYSRIELHRAAEMLSSIEGESDD